MGSFVLLVTALAFLAGWIRNELALTLLGTVFLCVLAYCFLAVFLLGVIHRRKTRPLSLVIASETVSAGTESGLLIKAGSGADPHRNYFWRLPAILIRCELRLETKDGRVIRHYADPGVENYSRFPVRERGAYYEAHDKLVIFDAAGFFRLSLPVGYRAGPLTTSRLFAVPRAAEELVPISLRSGGTEQRNESHYRKSDDLADHRPYIPGDDPRRINWKLYGHAPLGELFVREGEPEPPPHSRLLILIDTEADRSLYTVDEGRRAVDLLCESALAAALDFSLKGMDIKIGCTQACSSGTQACSSGTGGKIIGADAEGGPLNAAELAAALAWPAAIFQPAAASLPAGADKEISVLILALPRTTAYESALDRFLKNREGQGTEANGTDIVFVYDAEQRTGGLRAAEPEDAARVCVNLYNRKAGIHAGMAAVSAARGREAQ